MTLSLPSFTRCALAAVAFTALSPLAHADVIVDAANDFLSTFAGSTSSTDLDVIGASVTYDAGHDIFTLSGTMNGAIGTTASGFYVWGVNRGAGVASFAANGLPNILFDRVVLLRPDGTGNIGGGAALPPGAITITGNTISAVVSGSLLPSTGFANPLDYTWNLWPRDSRFAGFAAISDFAPDNVNFKTAAIPEPSTYALLLAGLGVVGGVARRRAAAACG